MKHPTQTKATLQTLTAALTLAYTTLIVWLGLTAPEPWNLLGTDIENNWATGLLTILAAATSLTIGALITDHIGHHHPGDNHPNNGDDN